MKEEKPLTLLYLDRVLYHTSPLIQQFCLSYGHFPHRIPDAFANGRGI